MPGERFIPNVSAHSLASTVPDSFLADPDHASVIRNSTIVQKAAATAPDASGAVAAATKEYHLSKVCFV
jgi:hypothetical protein